MTAVGLVANRAWVSDCFWSSGTQKIGPSFRLCHLGQGSVEKL